MLPINNVLIKEKLRELERLVLASEYVKPGQYAGESFDYEYSDEDYKSLSLIFTFILSHPLRKKMSELTSEHGSMEEYIQTSDFKEFIESVEKPFIICLGKTPKDL